MKHLHHLLITALICAVSNYVYAQELKYDWGVADTIESHFVGPGMKYTKVIYPQKPVIVWFVEIDLTNPYAKVEQVQSRHAVPDVLRWDVMTHYKENSRPGHQVKVAWNHDFFSYDQGICIGLNISEGEVPYTKWGRSLLAITEERKAEVFIPSLDSHITTADGTTVTIDNYNQPATGVNGDCVLYNRFNSSTLSSEGKYIAIKPLDKWLVNGNPIRCEVTQISDLPIQTTENQYVIYLRNGKTNALDNHIAAGDIITITQSFNTPAWGTAPANILNAFHGYPSIVHDGVLHDGEFNNFENGREYELSSRVMAGVSKDKSKLYIATTELSSNSVGVDCIELSAWMVERGAWDVVNFDSGGSAAIVIDEKMLNLPGRGSVRPVEDAALAVSLAPEDNNLHHITFSLPRISPMIISRTPLRVISYNQYDEILENDLKGCTFEVVPSSLGYVDDEAVFHASEIEGTGKIIATYSGNTAEIAVSTVGVSEVKPDFTSLIVDDKPRQITGIYGIKSTGKVGVDVGAFSWTTSPEGIASISPEGIITGLQDGETTVTGTIGSVSFSFDTKVEIVPEHYRIDEKFENIESGTFKATFSSTLKNRVISYTELPENWTSGAKISFDLGTGRGSYIKFSPKYSFYSLPEAMSLRIYDNPDIVGSITFQFVDAMGQRFNLNAQDAAPGDNEYKVEFKENDADFEIYRYPITLQTMTVNLSGTANPGSTIAIGELKSIYHGYSSVTEIFSDNKDNNLDVTVAGEQIFINHNENVKSLSLYDATGRTVAAVKAEGTQTVINAKELSVGIYIIAARSTDSVKTAKIFIK